MRLKTRGRWLARATAACMALLLSVAAAFFFASILADGTSPEVKTGNGGTAELNLSVSVAGGVKPGGKVPVTATINNTTPQVATFDTLEADILGSAECTADMELVAYNQGTSEVNTFWTEGLQEGVFAGGADHAGPYPAETVSNFFRAPEVDVKLLYAETGLDQSACEEVGYRVHLHAVE